MGTTGSTVSAEILSRIAKLLALANNAGATEAEAANAAGRAQELLLRYNLDVASVEAQAARSGGAARQSDTIHKTVEMGIGKTVAALWCMRLAKGVARVCNCAAVFYETNRQIVFVGSPTDIDVATQLYNFLAGQGLEICKKQFRDVRTEYKRFGEFRYGFMVGFCDRLYDRLWDAYELRIKAEDESRATVDGEGAATALVRCKTDDANKYVYDKWRIDLDGKQCPAYKPPALSEEEKARRAAELAEWIRLDAEARARMCDKKVGCIYDKGHKGRCKCQKPMRMARERIRRQPRVDTFAYHKGDAAGQKAEISKDAKLR